MDKELFDDLMQGLKEAAAIKRGELQPAQKITVRPLDVKRVREATGLSQAEFAQLVHISGRTLQNWEQGRNKPTGPASALLQAIEAKPEAVVAALNDFSWIRIEENSGAGPAPVERRRTGDKPATFRKATRLSHRSSLRHPERRKI